MTTPVDRATIDRLAARIKRLELAQERANRTPQLKHSSIDDGALTVKSDGQVTAIVGQQYDGTAGVVVVAGPTPPVPTMPAMDTVTSGVRLTWHGDFVQTTADRAAGRPTVAPQDFAKVELAVSDDVDFPDDPAHTRDRLFINSAAGGYQFAPWAAGTPLYARARTWSQAGKASAWSLTAGPVDAGKVGVGDVGFDLASLNGTHVFYGTSTPTATAFGELWLKQVAAGPPAQFESWRWTPADGTNPDRWAQLPDQSSSSAALVRAVVAQAATDAGATLFDQDTTPTWSGAAGSAYWVDEGNDNRPWIWDGAAWADYAIGSGEIETRSVIASSLLATGSVSASLLEAILVLVTAIIAGDPNGTHAAMKPDGLHIYDSDGNEVARLGTTTNDYFGIVDSSGQLLASIDDTGAAHLAGLTVDSDPLIMGTKFSSWIGHASGAGNGLSTGALQGAQHYYGFAHTTPANVTAEMGLIEAGCYVDSSRMYLLIPEVDYRTSDTGTECRVRVREHAGTSNITGLTDPVVYVRYHTPPHANFDTSVSIPALYRPVANGYVRLLLTLEAVGTGYVDVYDTFTEPVLTVIDLGPAKGYNASVNNITSGGTGGATTPPKQQYYVDLAPAATGTFRGDGVQRSDTSDIVQGPDPSGFNGDGSGWWTFNLPDITGTVDRVDWYVYCNHTYYNGGGRALWRPIHTGPPNWPINSIVAGSKGIWDPGVTYPKPGGVTVTVPPDWFSLFAGVGGGGGRAIGIAAGTAGDAGVGGNLNYYCRFDGPSARLRIWFTQ